ncbi:MAG: hypothetical protein E4G95_06740, partial [Bacteroidia bacterium]
MNIRKINIIALLFLIVSPSYSQGNRTLETRVADLLARMPVYNRNELVRQMDEMTLIGTTGRNMICDMIVTPGSGDDTGARFAIESYSRYLSEFGKATEAGIWETECINYTRNREDIEVKSFFLRQLVYIGTKSSSELAAGYLKDSRLCAPALAVIGAARVRGYDKVLAEELDKDNVQCAAGIMNILGTWNPDIATDAIIRQYGKGDTDTRAAALRALSHSSDNNALKVLKSAATDAGYGWEPTGAITSLLTFAEEAGDRGDLATLRDICVAVSRKAVTESSIQYRTAALAILVEYTGLESIEMLTEAFKSPDIRYRIAAMGFARDIPGNVATRKYISLIESLPVESQADLIRMLGDRGDPLASEAIVDHLFRSVDQVRIAAAMALASLDGKQAVPHLVDYLRSFPSIEDQQAGMIALSTVADSNSRILISKAIEDSPNITRANLISVLAIGGENRYFDQVVFYCRSEFPDVRQSAFEALPALAG